MRKRKILMAVSTILMALILTGLSVIGIVRKDDAEYRDVEATIVRINEEYDHINEQYEYTVFVDYEVDGVKYKSVEYGAYDSSMEIGDTVEAKYDVNNPEVIEAEGSEKVPYIVGGVGIAVAVFGVFMLIKAIKEN